MKATLKLREKGRVVLNEGFRAVAAQGFMSYGCFVWLPVRWPVCDPPIPLKSMGHEVCKKFLLSVGDDGQTKWVHSRLSY